MDQKKAQSIANRIASRFGVSAPRVRVRECKKCRATGWSGRYFPRAKRVQMDVGRKMPEAKQRALIGHETSHKITRDVYCKHGVKCSYNGEHDARFYGVAEKVHRMIGTSAAAARELEAGSGYSPPDRWMEPKGTKRARRRRRITGLPR